MTIDSAKSKPKEDKSSVFSFGNLVKMFPKSVKDRFKKFSKKHKGSYEYTDSSEEEYQGRGHPDEEEKTISID